MVIVVAELNTVYRLRKKAIDGMEVRETWREGLCYKMAVYILSAVGSESSSLRLPHTQQVEVSALLIDN